MSDGNLQAALAAVDAINADDPNTIDVDGQTRPKELVHAERMTSWLARLDPAADAAQHLAARGHHVRRWAIPRTDYPEGRSGYLQWRTELSRRHADETARAASENGFDAATCDRVRAIVRKRGLGSDPAVQTHEDALCLVFLELQFADLLDRLGRVKTIEVVAKTVRKMSPEGIAAAAALDLDPGLHEVLIAGVDLAQAAD